LKRYVIWHTFGEDGSVRQRSITIPEPGCLFAAEVPMETGNGHAVDYGPPPAGSLLAAQEVATLETTAHWYQRLFEAAPIGYVVTDHRGRIRETNRLAQRLLGRGSSHEASLLVSALPVDERRKLRGMFMGLRAGAETVQATVNWTALDDVSQMRVAARAVTIESEPFILWVLDPGHLEAGDEVRRVERPAWIEGLVHELRTPLTIIAGNSRLLPDTLGHELSEDARETLEAITSQCLRLESAVLAALEPPPSLKAVL
jgi:PAS domain S-box-containing protein